jgi:hypothetical protein
MQPHERWIFWIMTFLTICQKANKIEVHSPCVHARSPRIKYFIYPHFREHACAQPWCCCDRMKDGTKQCSTRAEKCAHSEKSITFVVGDKTITNACRDAEK